MNALAAVGEGLAELGLGPKPGDVQLGFGGDAANVCVMAARLGIPARLFGRVGDDPLGARLVSFLEAQGVDLAWVRRDADAPTGLYVNETGPAGEHRFSYWRRDSAGSRLQPADLNESLLENVGMLVFTGVTLAISATSADAARHAAELARAGAIRVACVLNHRPALGGDVARLAELARASDVLIASRDDARAVFGTADWTELRALLDDGPAELVVTDGDRPALVLDRSSAASQPVPQVMARNAACAGDALAGAYLGSRLLGRPPATGLAWGVAAATLSVRRAGCATSYPTREQTASFLTRLPPHEAVDATLVAPHD